METEKNQLQGNVLRPELEKAINQIAYIKELYNRIFEDDTLGEYFENKLPLQMDQLTQIALTLGEIQGYTLANDILNNHSKAQN